MSKIVNNLGQVQTFKPWFVIDELESKEPYNTQVNNSTLTS